MRGRAVLAIIVLAWAGLAGRAWAADGSEGDPIESVNRRIFWFNERLDQYILEPVATGWDFVLPDRVQKSITNFFTNLRFPIVAINDVLQGKLKRSGVEVARFGVNTTVGVLGFFDPATGWGLERVEEDFGQTLGYWGVPPGPYLVLPILGPSNPRDGFGFIVDGFAAIYPLFVPIEYAIAPYTVEIINARSRVLEDVRDAREAAVDFYVFVRNAYVQRRRVLVNDGRVLSEAEEEELYYLDEE